jgi:glycosyltransferase involved in cell wall biosynthesis
MEADLSLVVHPEPGDVLFTCGLGWSDFDWSAIAALKAGGKVRVVSMVYDMIPILFPAWIPANHDVYLAHFLSLIDTADEVPCISRCTERDLRAFATAQGRVPPLTHVVHLGADLPAKPDPIGIEPAVVEKLSSGRFALTVGTFEVRKNYTLLLEVWDNLLSEPTFDLDLVIVGMRGWQTDDVIERLESSAHFGRRIFWFRNLGDGALSWLYEQCHMVLYPSLYEGWGLPVVEALQHGRTVIASNRGAVPEAGFGTARLIDPEDVESWCQAVSDLAKAERTDAPRVALPTWDETAAAIRSILTRDAVLQEVLA